VKADFGFPSKFGLGVRSAARWTYAEVNTRRLALRQGGANLSRLSTLFHSPSLSPSRAREMEFFRLRLFNRSVASRQEENYIVSCVIRSNIDHLMPSLNESVGIRSFQRGSWETCSQVKPATPHRSLSLVFSFVDAFEDGKARFLGVGNRQFVRRVKGGKHFAHRFLAGRAFGQRRGGERPAQDESPATDRAVPFAQFIFVQRHNGRTEG
jgi:hypothetical protein